MIAPRKPAGMSVREFQVWTPDVKADHRWHLVDGTPVCMAPASENHGRIQAEATILLGVHVRQHRPGCSVITAPGVVPRVRASTNERVPDLGVACGPPSGGPIVLEPLLLIEILSPSNEAMTRANVWAYTTIPSVEEVLLLSSTQIEAEVLRRGPGPDWQEPPRFLSDGDELDLVCIGLCIPLRDFYRTTALV